MGVRKHSTAVTIHITAVASTLKLLSLTLSDTVLSPKSCGRYRIHAFTSKPTTWNPGETSEKRGPAVHCGQFLRRRVHWFCACLYDFGILYTYGKPPASGITHSQMVCSRPSPPRYDRRTRGGLGGRSQKHPPSRRFGWAEPEATAPSL